MKPLATYSQAAKPEMCIACLRCSAVPNARSTASALMSAPAPKARMLATMRSRGLRSRPSTLPITTENIAAAAISPASPA